MLKAMGIQENLPRVPEGDWDKDVSAEIEAEEKRLKRRVVIKKGIEAEKKKQEMMHQWHLALDAFNAQSTARY